MAYDDITLVADAIHNPNEPRHFMQIVAAPGRRVARVGDLTIAESDQALVVKEVGRAIYDPVVYFPRGDVNMDALAPIDKSTHCPLKGDTEYFDVVGAADSTIAEGAWSYIGEMIAGEAIRDHIAFDTRSVEVR